LAALSAVAAVNVACVEGVGVWASRLPGWDAAREILRGERGAPEARAPRPAPELLAPTERRRAPDTVAVALEVASRACESAARDPKHLPSVFASTHGDLAITHAICDTLARSPALTSPTKFHNSVLNAAAGYWTIGTGCLEPYTAVSGHEHTFGKGLFEAVVQVASERAAVLFVAYDIECAGPVVTMAPSQGLLGMALVLAPENSSHTKARVRWELRGSTAPQPTAARAANAALVAGNAMAPCLPLLEALADGKARSICVIVAPQLVIDIHVEP